jgi:two-component system cell cycle sensor histidine kinase/response regulator CckA
MANERNANPKAGVNVSGLTIQLADDDAGIRQLVGYLLESDGYTVLEAADGVEALEVAEEHHGTIHLLLTDGPCRGCMLGD